MFAHSGVTGSGSRPARVRLASANAFGPAALEDFLRLSAALGAVHFLLSCRFGTLPLLQREISRTWIENEYAIALADSNPIADGHTMTWARTV